MEHGGQEMDSAYSLSPILYQLILPTLMETPSSSMQIPVSSDLSNETLTIVTESLNQMEGLTLQKGTDTVDVAPDHVLVHAEVPSASTQPQGTRLKKSMLRSGGAGCGSREKAEDSQRRKVQKSPERATHDTEILHPTVIDKPQGALSLVAPAKTLNSIVVAPQVSGQMSHVPFPVGVQ
jgi:hypothetical protein